MGDYRILVTGSRDWEDRDAVWWELKRAIDDWWNAPGQHDPDAVVIVHGHCPRGADKHADDYARQYGIRVEPHPAHWRPDGVFDRSAGFRRNAEMTALGADVCLAFIRNGSRGATHCADLAEKAGIDTRRFTDGS